MNYFQQDIKMFYLYIVLSWAFFVSVSATKGDIGWNVLLPAQDVSISTDFVSDGINVFVDASVNITRVSSQSTSLTLNFYTSAYMVNNNTDPNTSRYTLVHNETVDASDAISFTHPVFFNFPEPTQDLHLSVVVEDGGSENLTFESQGTVLSTRSQGARWAARVIGEYDHEINLGFSAELGVVKSNQVDEGGPRDLGVPVIATEPQLQVIPKDNASVVSTTTIPGSQLSTTTPYEGPSSPVYTVPKNPSVTVPNGHDSTTIPKQDPATPIYQQSGFITIIQTVTVCGCASPSPPETTTELPCPDQKNKVQARQLEPRQGQIHPAYISARFTYEDRNGNPQPVRITAMVLEARIYEGDTFVDTRAGIALSDVDGNAVFRFETLYGQRIEIITAFTLLSSDYYNIGTRNSEAEDLQTKVMKLDIISNPWKAKAGEIVYTQAFYEWSEYNSAFAVADAYRYFSDFMHTEVVRDEVEPVQVWFPALNEGTFFSLNGKIPYINLPLEENDSPSVMAHEYGHYAHFLARQKQEHRAGGVHHICGDGGNVKAETSFSEGYATAFGEMAIDETPLDDPSRGFIFYVDRLSPTAAFVSNVEAFSCNERFMQHQEGRVGAALFDLVDRKLDEFPTSSNELGRVEEGFDPVLLNVRWTSRFIFWLLLQNNPQTMEDYWYVYFITQYTSKLIVLVSGVISSRKLESRTSRRRGRSSTIITPTFHVICERAIELFISVRASIAQRTLFCMFDEQ